ncbi:AAA family ATPase [Photobacterium leiognathi]|uniref:AAA family ATPase n=1 Tax=Photobacterium leiognathi TaxID=553611 RepID=UPI002980BFB0|nr:AAA family ATPase [Photobacterium leiognathi]
MKLLAIYIRERHNVSDLLVSFCSEFYIKYENSTLTLNSNKGINISQRYYNSESSISLLVGDNGVGKSTIVESLVDIFSNIMMDGFSVWLNNNKIYIYDALGIISEVICNNFSYEISNDLPLNDNKNLFNLNVNNIFDVHKYTNDIRNKRKNVINLTNNEIIKSNKKKIAKEELERDFNFVNKVFKHKKPKLAIKLKIAKLLFSSASLILIGDTNHINRINNIKVDNNLINHDIDPINFENNVNKLIYYKYGYERVFFEYQEIENKILNFDIPDTFLFSVFHSILLEHINYKFQNSDDKRLAYYEALKDFIDHFHEFGCVDDVICFFSRDKNDINILKYSFLEKIYIELHDNENIDSYKKNGNIEFLFDDLDYFKWAIEEYDIKDSKTPFVDMGVSWGWSGMSTGESARLKLFSRIYDGVKRVKEISKNSWIYIIIDEIDLYLHPEWQRTIIKEIYDLIESLSDFETKISLIITSHSPIIASDVLAKDIIHLHRVNDKTIIKENTFGFGSNIYDLYYKTFSLQSTIGEHSKGIIDELVIKTSAKTLTKEEIEIVKSIGDEVVRDILLSRLKND